MVETLSNNSSRRFPALILAINIILTSLIVGRLIYHQRNLKNLLGARSGSQYTSIAAMIVESAGVNVVFQILALGSVKNGLSNRLFNFTLLGQIQASSIRSATEFPSADIFRTGVRDAHDHLPGRAREGVG
jgi:hypothetical protein